MCFLRLFDGTLVSDVGPHLHGVVFSVCMGFLQVHQVKSVLLKYWSEMPELTLWSSCRCCEKICFTWVAYKLLKEHGLLGKRVLNNTDTMKNYSTGMIKGAERPAQWETGKSPESYNQEIWKSICTVQLYCDYRRRWGWTSPKDCIYSVLKHRQWTAWRKIN